MIRDADADLKRRRRLANALLAASLLVCAIISIWPPAQSSFYPLCPIHEFLHLACPGCGATRALAALLRGHLLEAMRWNALFVVLLPLGLAGAVVSYGRAIRAGEFHWPKIPSSTLYGTLFAGAVFTVVRNMAV